jgi:pSer/pThr/pTyr-binding forkhead associated (FHA) protein
MFKDNGDQRSFNLTNQTTVVGRREDCDIRIPLAEVSRQHAEIHLNDTTVSLKDLKSANGTFVNNERISEHALTAGDHVVIGPIVFTVQIDGAPAEIKPVKTRRRKKPALESAGSSAAASDSGESFSDLLSADVEEDGSNADMSAADALADSLGESDLALDALSEGSSLNFDIDDLDLGDSKTED